jgi:DNA primase
MSIMESWEGQADRKVSMGIIPGTDIYGPTPYIPGACTAAYWTHQPGSVHSRSCLLLNISGTGCSSSLFTPERNPYMKFDEFFIEQVKNSVNIVDVVQGYVRLIKKGRNYQALCPFHSEKTPSFSVSASKQIFKCFGCGAAGDVFAFVSKIEGLSFPETVRLLAEKNGLSIPEPPAGSAPKEKNRKRLLELMSSAASFFRDALAEDPDGLDFLRDSGLSDGTRHQFGLGCHDGSAGLQQHLWSLSYSDEEIRQTGLDKSSSGNGKKAVVLPLTDISGRIINFAYLPVEGGSKEEILSPDTALFLGGRGFFGLQPARQAMREKDYVILTGKALDGMMLTQKGITNTVTCVGKGLSEQQARTLGRNTKKVIINHILGSVQGDILLKSVENLLAQGFTINVTEIPGGSSLRLLLEGEGLAGYVSRLKSSLPLFDYLLDLHLSGATGSMTSQEKKEILEPIKLLLQKVPSRIARSEYSTRIAGRLGLTVNELAENQKPARDPAVPDFPASHQADSESITSIVERDSFLNFTPELRDKIRAEHELTEIIGRYQKLEKRNHFYSGSCPFHPDSSSSLLVSKGRQIFKCLGCGAGGDLFSYISKFEELSLPEVILGLAVQSGIELPNIPGEVSRSSDIRCRLLGLMEEAGKFFRNQLTNSPSALKYLDNRKITDDTREQFSFGYAPGGNMLASVMQEKGYSLEELEAAGLAARNDSGEYYDRFRNRIILSIKDLQGKIIAFGGRALGDSIPKYLNSPETVLYNKRNQLFGLSDAREHIISHDFAILVEGYFDCVVPSQYGVKNIVASLGTSLTEQQVSLLGGFTRNVIVSFDPDTAGREAAARSVNMFLAHGFGVKVMQLPDGMDPDALIIEQGVDAYRSQLKNADPFIDFMIQKHQSSSASAMSPQGKQKIVSQIIPSLLMIPNRIERSKMAARAANLLKLDEKLIKEEMKRVPRQEKMPNRGIPTNQVHKLTTLSERILLTALLDRDRYLPLLDKLEENLFDGSGIKPIYESVLKLRQKGAAPSVTRVRDALDDTERDILEYWAVSEEVVALDKEIITNSITELQGKIIKRRSREIQAEIARSESGAADPDRIKDLLREKEHLRRQTLP